MSLVVTVPAKLTLFGEYAVDVGGSALGIAIDQCNMKLIVEISEKESFPDDVCKRLFQTACSRLNRPYRDFIDLKITSTIPKGMGSSSALCVGLAVIAFEYYGMTYTKEDLYQLALAMERIHFSPLFSGMDTRICIEGGCIRQCGEEFIHVNIPDTVTLSVFVIDDQLESPKLRFNGKGGSKLLNEKHITRIDRIIHDFSMNPEGVHMIRDLFRKNQYILRQIEVSTPENESIIDHICSSAKISGSGKVMIGYGVCDYADFVCKKVKDGVQSNSPIPLYLARLQFQLIFVQPMIGNASAPMNILINEDVSITLSDMRVNIRVHFIPLIDVRENVITNERIDRFLEDINPIKTTRIHVETVKGSSNDEASLYCALVGAIGTALDISSILSYEESKYWIETWCTIGHGRACRSIYPGAVLRNLQSRNFQCYNYVDFIIEWESITRDGINLTLDRHNIIMHGESNHNVNECKSMPNDGFVEKFIKFRNDANMNAFIICEAKAHVLTKRNHESQIRDWLTENKFIFVMNIHFDVGLRMYE